MNRKLILLMLAMFIVSVMPMNAAAVTISKGQTISLSPYTISKPAVIYYYPAGKETAEFKLYQSAGYNVVGTQANAAFAWSNDGRTYNTWTTQPYANSLKVKLSTGGPGISYRVTVTPIGWGSVLGTKATVYGVWF